MPECKATLRDLRTIQWEPTFQRATSYDLEVTSYDLVKLIDNTKRVEYRGNTNFGGR